MISVKNLKKVYKTVKNKGGFAGFMQNLFNREYKEVEAVKDITFDIQEGELVGFLGPNGAGKTTTMKMLSGILFPTKGHINVLGYTPFEKNHEFLRQIAFVMGQRNQLLWELPAIDTFRLNKEIYGISETEFKKTIHTLTDMLDAKDIITQPAKTLSLGQRMKMELISSLVHRPKVMFLDEPTIGLDVIAQKTIRDFIQNYQIEYKATILLTSHYMEDVRRLAERVIIIDHGSLLYDGKFDTLTQRYADKKTIEIIVEDMPKTSDLKKVGKIDSLEFPRIRFKAKRKDVPKVVEKISRNVSFIDINIEEERVEDIVRKIFQKK